VLTWLLTFFAFCIGSYKLRHFLKRDLIFSIPDFIYVIIGEVNTALVTFSFLIRQPHVTFVRFVLSDQSKPGKNRTTTVVGQATLCLESLLPGYRHVSLESEARIPLLESRLHMYVQIDATTPSTPSSHSSKKAKSQKPSQNVANRRTFAFVRVGYDVMNLTMMRITLGLSAADVLKRYLSMRMDTARDVADLRLVFVPSIASDASCVLMENASSLDAYVERHHAGYFHVRAAELIAVVPETSDKAEYDQFFGVTDLHLPGGALSKKASIRESGLLRRLSRLRRNDNKDNEKYIVALGLHKIVILNFARTKTEYARDIQHVVSVKLEDVRTVIEFLDGDTISFELVIAEHERDLSQVLLKRMAPAKTTLTLSSLADDDELELFDSLMRSLSHAFKSSGREKAVVKVMIALEEKPVFKDRSSTYFVVRPDDTSDSVVQRAKTCIEAWGRSRHRLVNVGVVFAYNLLQDPLIRHVAPGVKISDVCKGIPQSTICFMILCDEVCFFVMILFQEDGRCLWRLEVAPFN
jgi:hypothetical protein